MRQISRKTAGRGGLANGGQTIVVANKLEELVIRTRKITMTPNQLREQRQSFAYSNTNIENERIPREMVAEADRKIEADSGHVTGEPFQSTPRVRALRRPQVRVKGSRLRHAPAHPCIRHTV